MNILITQHGGSGNHGCEALVRTSLSLVKAAFPNATVNLYSYRTGDDQKYLSDLSELKIFGLRQLPGRISPYNLAYHARRVAGMTNSKLPINEQFRALVEQADLVVAIGGDNYCYNMGRGYWAIDRYIKAQGKRYVLLGCSVEPDDLPRGLARHLRLFDLITVRETLTYDAMQAQGMDNIALAPDPAFLLTPGECTLPPKLELDRAVGINISPLVVARESRPGITLDAFEQLALYLLQHTDRQIALIPHVVWPDNDDRKTLEQLYQRLKGHSDRVFILPDGGTRTLKAVISKLDFFVGARTHSTIAAYSSTVPTLALGYSVKARGIAKDLFGQFDGYVLPVQHLSHHQQLLDVFVPLFEKRQQIRQHLAEVMPEYKHRAGQVSNLIAQLESLPKTVAYAAAAEKRPLPGSSSGGLFGALAMSVLSGGGLVFGAAFDDNMKLCHIGASTPNELTPLLGSKYVRSDLGNSIQQAKEALETGKKVLFCGTPCQISAVKKAIDHENLLLLQVICHGTPTKEVFKKYLEQLQNTYQSKVKDYDFRNKSTGWESYSTTVTFENNEVYSVVGNDDPYMRLFLANLTLHEQCYTCRFKHSTAADITLGDFWGIKHFAPDFDSADGASLVLVHSPKGQAAFEKIQSDLRLQSVNPAGIERVNPCLIMPVARPSNRDAVVQAIENGEDFAKLAEQYIPKPPMRAKIKSAIKKLL